MKRRTEQRLILPEYVLAAAKMLTDLRNAVADRGRLNLGLPSLEQDERWNVTMAVSAAITEAIASQERTLALLHEAAALKADPNARSLASLLKTELPHTQM